MRECDGVLGYLVGLGLFSAGMSHVMVVFCLGAAVLYCYIDTCTGICC